MQTRRLILSLLLLTGLIWSSGCTRAAAKPTAPALDPAKRYAVYLSNGLIVFGKLHYPEGSWPEVTDVYYIRGTVNPDTKQTESRLVRRGNETHSPEKMVLNPDQILFVEPLGAGSKMLSMMDGAPGS